MEKELQVSTTKPQREILISNQAKQKNDVFLTNTNNWADIADWIKSNPTLEVRDLDAMDAVLKETKAILKLPAATIPDGKQVIFLFEAKVKSGATKAKAEKPVKTSDYSTMGYTDLRRLLSGKKAELEQLGIKLAGSPTRESLVDAAEKVAGIQTKTETKTTPKGNVKTVETKVITPEAKVVIEEDKQVLLPENQPTLEERVGSLELMFASVLKGLFSACKDFVPTTHKVSELVPALFTNAQAKEQYKSNEESFFSKEELDASALRSEAAAFKVR